MKLKQVLQLELGAYNFGSFEVIIHETEYGKFFTVYNEEVETPIGKLPSKPLNIAIKPNGTIEVGVADGNYLPSNDPKIAELFVKLAVADIQNDDFWQVVNEINHIKLKD